MAIKIGQEFERTSKATRFKDDVMTKAQMLACTDDNYSDGYLVVEKDSHDLYIYDSNATPSAETGKFVKKETGGGGSDDYSDLTNKPKINNIELNGNKKAEDLEIKTFGRYENEDVYGILAYTDFFGFKSDKSIQGYGSWGFAYDSSVKDVVMINSECEPADNHQIQRRLPTREAVNVLLANKQDTLQVTTLPTASATEEGNIYQYVGATDSNYTNGYFYQCQEVTPATDPKTYEWVQKDVQSDDGVPAGGTAGQILAKNSDDDGDAGWIVDTGKDLNKLVQWGSHTSQSPRTEYIPEITDSTTDPYHRVILHIPIQGSALQGIEATEESLKNCLKTRFKIRYNTGLNGTVVFTTTTEDTAGDGFASFGMKTNLTSGYDDSRLYIYLNETTISNDTLHLAVNYYVKFSASQTNHHGKPQNVVLLANDGYTFGIIDVDDPYYIHNSTKIALNDLQINNLNIPTSWGVAKTGNLKMYMTNKQSYQYLWFGNLGFSSVDDYVIFVDITGGMEAAWGKPTVVVSNKSAKEAGISLECDSAEATWFNVNYVIIGKGYGNITSGGGGGGDLPSGGTTGQALVKKSNTDGDVEWKTVSGGGASLTIDTTQVGYGEATISEGGQNLSFTNQNGQGVHIGGISEDGEMVTSKSYVDSKSPTIVNEGATFTNAQGNQKMQIRNGGLNSVIIKDTNSDGKTEYWSHEVPNKNYVDTTILEQEKTLGNAYYYTLRDPAGVELMKKSGGKTSNVYTGSSLTSDAIMLQHNSGSGATVQDLRISTQENGTCRVQMSDNMMSAFNTALGVGVNMEVGAEKWYGTFKENGVTYQTYTKTVFVPALSNTAGITTYDHGISGIKQIIGVFGFGTNGFVLNSPRQNAQDNIAIYQVSKSATNQTFSIEVGKDRSNMGAYVTLIYAKNN